MDVELLASLIHAGALNTFTVDQKECYRISTTAKFIIPSVLINEIKEEYDSEFEKGGMILFEPPSDSRKIWLAKELIFIDNRSGEPNCEYVMDKASEKKSLKLSCEKRLLPFYFHTHPTKSNNVLFEAMNYQNQQGTSINDQMYSLQSIGINGRHVDIGGKQLRLPDILIVGNGTRCQDVFVGLYNGLICPTSFTQHQEKIMEDVTKNAINWIQENVDTTPKKIIASIAAVLGVVLIFKYYKVAFPLFVVGSIAARQAVLSMQSENHFFGISHGEELSITIPEIDDEIILQIEADAVMKYKKYCEDYEQNSKQLLKRA